MPSAYLDDLPLEPVAGVLALAHGSSIAQNESNALDFIASSCHPESRAMLSYSIQPRRRRT
jgi:hypothetical protein